VGRARLRLISGVSDVPGVPGVDGIRVEAGEVDSIMHGVEISLDARSQPKDYRIAVDDEILISISY
jgi:hypothetical protein